jgi:enoyl-CoA hydratase
VNRVRPASQLETYVRDYAETIAINAPLTVHAVKLCVSEYLKNPEDRDLDACQTAVDACSHSGDYAEGRTAFMEKRRPVFRGR